MKNIRNILALVLVFFMISCEKDFLDINENPNVPFEANVPHLFTQSQVYMLQAHTTGNFLGTALNVYNHQLVARENPDQYGMPASSTLLSNTWNWFYYMMLPNLDVIIEMAKDEAEGERWVNHAGAAKIIKAFLFTQLVDLWGDVPFTEANRNLEGIIHPSLDSGAAIYNACFELIEEGIAMLDADGPEITGDVIFGGNVNHYKRAGNALMLNMLNKTRKAKGDITGWQAKMDAIVNADLLTDDLHFEMFYTTSTAPDQRHPGFASGAYAGSQLTQYISPWIYEIMNGLTFNATENPFAGIQDPRVPYFWVNQLEPGDEPDNPWEYKHGQFVSIFFGSIGPNRDMGQDGAATTVGIYPVGGKFDDGEGGSLSIDDGTGVAPGKFFTYVDQMFVKTELSLTEGVDFGASTADLLHDAIVASFAHIDHVVARNGAEDVPVLSGTDEVNDYIDAIMEVYDNAANDEDRLEIIMTQKWIANFYNGIQNYTDYRRTGFPVYFDANVENISPDPYEPDEPIVPTQLTRSYPRTLWYPQNEVELNPQVDQKPNQADVKVFWDK